MKRLYSFFVGIVAIILVLWGISYKLEADSTQGTIDKLVIYNWGDYIDPELLDEFTAETGIQVDYQTFDSNESMYTKIKQGGTIYDLAVPSEYMISKMTEENMLVKLDKSKIEGLENIDPQFMGLSFDKNNDYSIPYFWGTLGIVFNDTMVENPPQEWEDLWSDEYRDNIMLIDGVREVMGFGLQSLGYSLNSKNPIEIEEAAEHLYNLTLQSMKVLRAQRPVDYSNVETKEISFLDIELPDVRGEVVKLSTVAPGKVVLINFTAYQTEWSPALNMALGELYTKYHDQELEIYQVSLDSDFHFWRNGASNLPWVTVHDPQSVYSQVAGLYNVKQLPALFILDRKGNLVKRVEDVKKLEADVKAVL